MPCSMIHPHERLVGEGVRVRVCVERACRESLREGVSNLLWSAFGFSYGYVG